MSAPVDAGGRKLIYRLPRYLHIEPVRQCPYCQQGPSMGDTDYGTLGCAICQPRVDAFIHANFQVVALVVLPQDYEEE